MNPLPHGSLGNVEKPHSLSVVSFNTVFQTFEAQWEGIKSFWFTEVHSNGKLQVILHFWCMVSFKNNIKTIDMSVSLFLNVILKCIMRNISMNCCIIYDRLQDFRADCDYDWAVNAWGFIHECKQYNIFGEIYNNKKVAASRQTSALLVKNLVFLSVPSSFWASFVIHCELNHNWRRIRSYTICYAFSELFITSRRKLC